MVDPYINGKVIVKTNLLITMVTFIKKSIYNLYFIFIYNL